MTGVANRVLLFLIFILIASTTYSQDISGTWVGNWGKGNQNSDITTLRLELQSVGDTTIAGALVIEFSGDEFHKYAVSGHVINNVVYINEDSGIAHNVSGFHALRDYKMTVISVNGQIRLEGISKSYSMGILTASKELIWFEREIPTDTETIQHVANTSSDTLSRQVKIIEVIEVTYSPTEIRVELTDNARIDNDEISLYVNKKKVISRESLSHTPLIYNITPAKNEKEIEIAMYAESCGSMPPCTANMKIITSTKTYSVDIESNYNSNGAVLILVK